MSGAKVAATLALLLSGGCSPYLYSSETATLSDGIAKLRASQEVLDRAYPAAVNQTNTDSARAGRRAFIVPAECVETGRSCVAVERPKRASRAPTATAAATRALGDASAGLGPAPDLAPSVPIGCLDAPPVRRASRRPNVSAASMLAALDSYSKALAAVTNAKDRAEFDAASTALAASTDALAGMMIGGPPGAGGAAVATLVIEAARYGIAVSLDARRFSTLRCAVLRSQEAVAVLGIFVGQAQALGVDRLRAAYIANSDAVTFNMSLRSPAGKWEDNVARQQMLAAAIGSLRREAAVEAADAMVKANDELAEALRTGRGQAGALASVVGDFAAKAAALERAVAAR